MVVARMHGSDLVFWDEFAHWGQMTKELFRLDAFYTVDQTTLLYHNDYPPIIPLWEMLCCKLAGRFSGQFMYSALWLLQLSMFLPFIEIAGKKLGGRFLDASPLITFVLLFSLVLVPGFDNGDASFWLSIYPDTILGLISGLGIYLALQKEKSRSLWAGMPILLGFLVLVKQSSLFFVGCILLISTIVSLVSSPKKQRQRNLIFAFLTAIVCVAFFASWKYVLSTSTLAAVHGQFSAPLKDLLSLPDILTGADTTYRPDVVNLFFDALVFRSITSYLWLPVTYVGATCFLVFASTLYCFALKIDKAQSACLIGSQIAVSILYAAFMLVMYLFSFSEADGRALVCYERYMNTALIGLYAATFMFAFQHATTSSALANRIINTFVLALCLILIVSPNAMRQIRTEKNITVREFKEDGKLLKNLLPEGSSVFVINQGKHPFETLEIAYYADGIKVSREVEAYYSVDSLSWEVSPDKLVELIQDENYIYAKTVDQQFNDAYKDIFSSTLESGTIYSVNSVQDGKIIVSPLEPDTQ